MWGEVDQTWNRDSSKNIVWSSCSHKESKTHNYRIIIQSSIHTIVQLVLATAIATKHHKEKSIITNYDYKIILIHHKNRICFSKITTPPSKYRLNFWNLLEIGRTVVQLHGIWVKSLQETFMADAHLSKRKTENRVGIGRSWWSWTSC